MPYGLEDTVDLKEKERRIDEAYHMRRWPYTDGRSSAALSPSYDKPRLRSYAAHRDGNEDVDTRPRRRRFDGGDSDDDDGGNDDDTYDSLPARSYARHARPRARHRRLSGEERKESDDSSYDTFDSRNDLADKHAQRSTRRATLGGGVEPRRAWDAGESFRSRGSERRCRFSRSAFDARILLIHVLPLPSCARYARPA